jgi:shikimate kinase
MARGREGRPIVLTGLMLSGKSTVGALVAEGLGWPFVDVDAEIVARTGRSIAEWFEEGETAFRRVEREVLAELVTSPGPRVIAAGGGALEDAESRRLCRERAFVVYLEATAETLAGRLSGPSGRPLLDGASDPREALAQLLAKRRANYVAAQHRRQPADGRPEDIARAIIDAYGEHTGD